jgi:tungstate transport system substrate-binding protein
MLFPAPTAPGRAVRLSRRAALLVLLLLPLACGDPAASNPDIVLATTTSVDDSGLLDELLPAFREEHPSLGVRLVAVGSGQALALGRRGDADVLLVHDPEGEQRFMDEGMGRRHLPLMRNDYIVVGPPADPAGARATGSAAMALRAVADGGGAFVSRGDSSGTHRAELRLWRSAGLNQPDARVRVVEAGQGMAETLMIASERSAYTLTDRATFRSLEASLHLVILHEGDSTLVNSYSVITVRHSRNPAAADTFADWITGSAAARIIGSFGGLGEPMFEPLTHIAPR